MGITAVKPGGAHAPAPSTPGAAQPAVPATPPTVLGTRSVLSVDRHPSRMTALDAGLITGGVLTAVGAISAFIAWDDAPVTSPFRSRNWLLGGPIVGALAAAAITGVGFLTHRNSHEQVAVYGDRLPGPQEALATARSLHEVAGIARNQDGTYSVLYDHGKIVSEWGVEPDGSVVHRDAGATGDLSSESLYDQSSPQALFAAMPRDANLIPGAKLAHHDLNLEARPPDGMSADLAVGGREYDAALTGQPVSSVAAGIELATTKVEQGGAAGFAISYGKDAKPELDALTTLPETDPRGASAADAYSPSIVAAVTSSGIYEPQSTASSQPQPAA